MKIEQISKNSYRVRKQCNGTQYTLYFDHKPTKKDIDIQFAIELNKDPKKANKGTFKDGYNKYYAMKSNILKSTTLLGYESMFKLLTVDFVNKQMCDITQADIQMLVNEMSAKYSPKTVRNAHGLISSVLRSFYPEMTIRTTLPTKEIKEPYIPTDDEIKAIFKEVAGTEYEVPFALATLGLRRSEICALSVDDLEGNLLHINKSYVKDTDGTYFIRNSNKTESSTRTIAIPSSLADKIRKKGGMIYDGFPNSLRRRLVTIEKQLDIQEFTLHTLRHYFATYAHSIGMTDAQIQEMGGWSTDSVMKKVYRRAANIEDAQSKAVNHLDSLLQ